MRKIRIGVLFGGRSAEHEVSILSAGNVVNAIDRSRYEIVPIGIDRSGRWVLAPLVDDRLPRAVPAHGTEVALVPGGRGRIVATSPGAVPPDLGPIDVLFPVLHGPFGEDGSIQGAAETADLPYVGCGIVGSAAAMDKDIAKRLLRDAGLAVAASMTLRRGDDIGFDAVAERLGLPLFVKPARQGSSIGTHKVESPDGFGAALADAFRFDDKVLVEEFVAAREVECAVLEDASGRLTVSYPGEIIPSARHGFYSYEAKYIDPEGAVVKVPADLPEAVGTQVREMSERAFRALGCEGMARVDFFLRPDLGLLVNEVNTIPGFTDISMYPKALEASGVPYGALIEVLIEHALRRHEAVSRAQGR